MEKGAWAAEKGKDKLFYFGNSAENYVAKLFEMCRNPNGSQRPDLISLPGKLTPRLSIEVKSGQQKKGQLVDYQLHYPFTLKDDYTALFGNAPVQNKEILPGMGNILKAAGTLETRISYYYNVIDRTCKTPSDEISDLQSTLGLNFGDQFLAPHEFGFYTFAAGYSTRTGRSMKDIITELKKTIKLDRETGLGHYESRKKNKNSRQNIYGRDILALVKNDMKLTTEAGKIRLDLIYENYRELASLKSIEILGPNGSKIYVLANPQDENLFNVQLRKIIEGNVSVLEKIHQERQEAAKQLGKFVQNQKTENLLFDTPNETSEVKKMRIVGLSREDTQRFEQLACWCFETNSLNTLPQKPRDEIPF